MTSVTGRYSDCSFVSEDDNGLFARSYLQCNKIEENLRKNNSKRAYQLVKDLTTVKQGKAVTVQDCSEKKKF